VAVLDDGGGGAFLIVLSDATVHRVTESIEGSRVAQTFKMIEGENVEICDAVYHAGRSLMLWLQKTQENTCRLVMRRLPRNKGEECVVEGCMLEKSVS
jgi:hypothetical protein